VKDYIVDVVFATREPANYGMARLQGMIRYGGVAAGDRLR